jgi:hypothetical protein
VEASIIHDVDDCGGGCVVDGGAVLMAALASFGFGRVESSLRFLLAQFGGFAFGCFAGGPFRSEPSIVLSAQASGIGVPRRALRCFLRYSSTLEFGQSPALCGFLRLSGGP